VSGECSDLNRIKCQAFIPDQPERDLLGIRGLLEEEKGGERLLVDQLRASWNSLLSWLREVQAWGQGAEAEG
jgi:hypothetical protein